MPLIHSGSNSAFKKNVGTLMGEIGKSPHIQSRAQALAIAYETQRRNKGHAAGGTIWAPLGILGTILGQRIYERWPKSMGPEFNEAFGMVPNQRRQPPPISSGKSPYLVDDQIPDNFASGGSPYGFIHGFNPGRSDTVPTKVKPQSYVIPADVVSGLGQGNSLAGANALDRILKNSPISGNLPKFHKGPQRPRGFAGGGGVDIQVSDGEYVLSPDEVAHIGEGDIEYGHKILDVFVLHARQNAIKHLANLPPPKGSEQEEPHQAMMPQEQSQDQSPFDIS